MVAALCSGALGIGLFQAQLEAHHEVDPLLGLAGQGLDDRRALFGERP